MHLRERVLSFSMLGCLRAAAKEWYFSLIRMALDP